MITKTNIDEGHAFDWGKTSPDYAVYRPGYPASFYTILQAVGIGTPGQDILNRPIGDSYTRRSRHVEITRLHGLPGVPMSCGLI